VVLLLEAALELSPSPPHAPNGTAAMIAATGAESRKHRIWRS
jgi:hypothetical protein